MNVLPPPPPERIVSPGARHVSVAVKQPNGYQLSNAGAVLAWARLRNGAWAMLFVWTGLRRVGGERQPSVRWSWCWVGRRDVYVHEPVKQPNPWGMAWYGQHSAELEAGIAEAVASLPESMRAAALKPVPRGELLRLDSLNPFMLFSPRG